jgi:hypothetical protein
MGLRWVRADPFPAAPCATEVGRGLGSPLDGADRAIHPAAKGLAGPTTGAVRG